jgi:hypothetical protein
VLERRFSNICAGAMLIAIGAVIIWLNIKGKDVEGGDLIPED